MTRVKNLMPWALCFGLFAATGCEDGLPLGPLPPDVSADTTPDAVPDVESPDPGPGLGVDYAARPGGPVARFDPVSDDFTAVPWPTDRHLLREGLLGLGRFPNPGFIDLIDTYADYGEAMLDGWGRNGAAYFELDRGVDPASLPDSRATMEDPGAAVQWVRVDQDAPDYGARLPLVFRMVEDPTDPYYLGPTLAVRPVYGFPLADGGTYCVVLTRLLTDAEGLYLKPSAAFAEALASEASLAPLRAWLPHSPLGSDDIAAATCFRAQDATAELAEVAAYLDTLPVPALSELTYAGQSHNFQTFTAFYDSPNFQSGTRPYTSAGGDIRFDASGLPIVTETERLRVRILVPRRFNQPAGGWPVVLYGHGTGGSWETCARGAEAEVLQAGLVQICIDQPLHGPRGTSSQVNILQIFNFTNPASGRTSFRQSAIDILWQSRLVAAGSFDFPADATGLGLAVTLDPTRIAFFGHSHGGLAGALALAVDPRLRGGVLSGASGVLIETILRRKDPLDIRAMIALVAGLQTEQLDTFHPVVNLAQMLVDATDPVNYAPYWLHPRNHDRPKDVLMTAGELDDASPAVGADAVAAAGGLPLIAPVNHPSPGHDLRDMAPALLPLRDNLVGAGGVAVTGGIRQYAGGDHFVALQLREAIDLWLGFLRGYRDADAPLLAY